MRYTEGVEKIKKISFVQSKKELRKDYKKVLANLDPRWIEAASHRVARDLSEFLKSGTDRTIHHVLCFTAFFPGEVDLTTFISDQLEIRQIYLPILHEDGKMTFISVESDWQESSTEGAFGISQPTGASGIPYDLENAHATAIVVPGLVYDRNGNRLGRGKGYYDRFLGNRRCNEILKIGVCWELQLLNDVPSESHDVSMDFVCHERGILRTGPTFED